MQRYGRAMGRALGLLSVTLMGICVLSVPLSSDADHDSSGDVLHLAAFGPARHRLGRAVEVLASIPQGRELLSRVEERWNVKERTEFLEIFQWSRVSKTDAVLTRYFNPSTGKEYRERRVTIYLRQDQSFEDLVLDIAHELTHAVARPEWDPYDPELTPGRYILTSIEGEGGEVEALMTECRIGLALSEVLGGAQSRCNRYRDPESGRLERERVRQDFYRVGKWRAELLERLGVEGRLLSGLSAEAPQLFSSTGHAPYPVALLNEFDEITRIACENSKRRLEKLSGRTPASWPRAWTDTAHRFLAKRCEAPRSAGMSVAR